MPTERLPIGAFLLLALAACATDEDYYAAQCGAEGLQAGTPAYDTCVAEERAFIEQHRREMARFRRNNSDDN